MSFTLPWRFLEEGRTEIAGNACRPLTICDADDNDLAQVFSADDSTVATTRAEAVAAARLIASAPELLLTLEDLVDAIHSDGVARVAYANELVTAETVLRRALGATEEKHNG